MTPTERVQAHRQRQDSEGKMQVNVTLPRTTVKKLDRIAERDGMSRADVIEKLITAADK